MNSKTAEDTESGAELLALHGRWVAAAEAFITVAAWWGEVALYKRGELCLRAAASVLERAADELAQKDFEQEQRRRRKLGQ